MEILQRVRFRDAAYQYLTYAGWMGLAVLIYRTNAYYLKFLRPETQWLLLTFYQAYLVLGLPYYLITGGNLQGHRGILILSALKRVGSGFWKYLREREYPQRTQPKLDPREKTIILFWLVKFFFLPVMINFAIGNIHDLLAWKGRLSAVDFSVGYFLSAIYPLLLTGLFTLDALIFTFGYTVEAKICKNEIRSVESTFFGWFVTLLCYPPFHEITGTYLSWHPNDYFTFENSTLTAVVRCFVLILIGFYVWASVALGAKASNLTNRGIVRHGPYAFVRHPAYICKNLAWWITTIPLMSGASILSASFWSLIYFARAMTEERHLIQDPDYQAYCKKVRWRFIPFVI